MKREFEVKLFDGNLSSPTFMEDLTPLVQGLRFSTKLHGGYYLCSFNLDVPMSKGWEWLTKRMFYRLEVADGQVLLFEGRLQDIELTFRGVHLVFYGYYSSLNDDYYTAAYNDVASEVIKAALTAASPQINADQTHIDATDIIITSAADASYLDISVRELAEKLAAFSDSSQNEWHFAVWEDRIPYFSARSISAVDWKVRLDMLNRFALSHRAGLLWNSAYAVYLAAGVLTRTADADDTTSQTKYGLTRRFRIPNLGTVVAEAATAQRDYWVEQHKDIWPTLEDFVLGDTVLDVDGVPHPSYKVKAGDVIRVLDLFPVTQDLDAVERDALRTFFVMETEYEAETGLNRLVVDTPRRDLTALLARIDAGK